MVHMFYSSDQMSWLRYICIKSFKIHYPDIPLKLWVSKEWSPVKTWDSEEQQEFHTTPLKGTDYITMLEDLGVIIVDWEQPQEVTERFGLLDPIHQADIFRYWVLSQEGGYFCDTDILFLDDSLKELLENPKDVCVYYGDFPIGFIGGKGKGSKWQEVYDACLRSSPNGYQSFGAPLIKQLWFDCPHEMMNIPKYWFYYYDHFDIWQLWHREAPTDHLPALHLYLGGALSQIYNRLLTADNYMEYPSTVTNAIKELLDD